MLIVRVTQSGGERETVVRLPDGQQRTFGKDSVQKIVEASELETTKFLEDLSQTELRGLVHEATEELNSSDVEEEEWLSATKIDALPAFEGETHRNSKMSSRFQTFLGFGQREESVQVGQRLLEGSQLYHSRLAELDRRMGAGFATVFLDF